MHDLILNTNLTLMTMIPILTLQNLPTILHTQLTSLPILVSLLNRDPRVNQRTRQPSDIQINQHQNRQVKERLSYLVVIEVHYDDHRDEINDQETSQEENV